MSEVRAHDAATSVGAGGIVPLGAKLPEDQRTSAVTARVYSHPALDGKVVVRLEPDAVAAGTDAEMAAFGFSEPDVSKSLGLVRYRSLGFPAWALVHEPKKAKAALDVTEDLRKAKRLVSAKPGAAKEAFEKIAKQLQRTAPQFLPSFWEEAGRVVADQASQSMAAQCFEKARAAERAYKLKTNPEDSDAVFVEFALLGALSAKTLSAYAKEIAKSAGGKEAYRRYRAIIVKRALGGMPPYSGMGKDLRALAAAAGADVDAEDDTLVPELIDAPGIAKAPIEFWTTYRDTLIRLGAKVRARMRNIWPSPRGGTDDTRKAFKKTWLDLLGVIGALDDLPDEGLGAWATRLVKFAGGEPEAANILRAIGPRLAASGQAVGVLVEGDYWSEDLNLEIAELLLGMNVKLADPRDQDSFSTEWMNCDPLHVAEHAVYSKKLVELLENTIGDKDHEHKMTGKQGYAAGRRLWIENQIAHLDRDPLTRVAAAIDVLETKTTPETFLPFQDLHERLGRIDLSLSLAANLRGGIADELGWPAYEEAVKTLGAEFKVGGAFPIVCAWNASKVIAIGREGVVAEHDLVYKATSHQLEGVLFLDGQFLVVLEPKKGWQTVAYWSSTPKQHFDLEASVLPWGGESPTAWQHPDGGVSLGEAPFHAGDKKPTGYHTFVATRDAMWHPEYKGWRPAKKGWPATPPFVGDWEKREGWTIEYFSCVMVPAPDGLDSSPLGMRDGMLGLRVRQRESDPNDWSQQPYEVERIDGVKWEGTISPFALLVLPGDATPRPITSDGSDRGPAITMWAPDTNALGTINNDVWAARGWGVPVPPAAFWDFLRPRDPAGSHALRAITIDAARTILEAARVEVAAGGELGKRALELTEKAVRAVRPAFTDEKLIRGIAGVAEYAAELANKLANLVAERAKEHADPTGQTLAGDAAQVRKLAAALSSGRASKIPDFDLELPKWLSHGRALATLAMSPVGTAEDRRKARDLVRALSGTILADDLSRFRVIELAEPDEYDDDQEWNTVVIGAQEASIFAIHASNQWALELSTDGKFRVPTGWKVDKEHKLSRGIGTRWADAFLELPDAPIPWDPAAAQKLAERADLSLAEATLLFIGAPDRDAWGKDFLGKQRREIVGLKMGDADAARTTFKDMPDEKLYGVITAAVPDDANLLVKPLVYAERLADAWKAKFGKRAKVPQELVALAKRELDIGDDLSSFLAAFAGDDDAKFLQRDPRSFVDLGGWEEHPGFNAATARSLATFIGWLFLQRPVGCGIRAGIPRVIEKMRAVLDDPETIWRFEDRYFDDESAKGKAAMQSLIDLVGGKAVEMKSSGDDEDDQVKSARDDGTCIAAVWASNAGAGFRPAKLTPKTVEKVRRLALLMTDEENTWGDPPSADVAIAELVRGGFGGLAERVAKTDVPEGQYEANPLLSAPKLVAKVATAHAISEAAAMLYLQTLALAEPTQAKVQLWNGWKPKQYKDAAAELVKKKLVTEGKRERAGRTIFLKGGYSKGDGKNLPLEEWKQVFYETLSRHVITEPAHTLFARAYKRVEGGDKP